MKTGQINTGQRQEQHSGAGLKDGIQIKRLLRLKHEQNRGLPGQNLKDGAQKPKPPMLCAKNHKQTHKMNALFALRDWKKISIPAIARYTFIHFC